MLVAASILAADFSQLGKEITVVDKCGADWIHLDVMDGQFVNNLTFGAPIIKKIRQYTQKKFDVHLMISTPEKLLSDFIDAGADLITIHFEATEKIDEIFDTLKKMNISIGISIKPNTEVKKIFQYLELVDLVLVMSVEPGWGGQKFNSDVLKKVEQLDIIRKEDPTKYSYRIEIDGGINDKNVVSVAKAGCDIVVAGSFIFKSEDYSIPISQLKDSSVF